MFHLGTHSSSSPSLLLLSKVEGLTIGGKELGLFNFRRANNIRGATGRNKFKEKKVRDVRFAGDGYLALDRTNYADMDYEMDVKMTIRPERVDGVLFVAGNAATGHYAALELRNGYLAFR